MSEKLATAEQHLNLLLDCIEVEFGGGLDVETSKALALIEARDNAVRSASLADLPPIPYAALHALSVALQETPDGPVRESAKAAWHELSEFVRHLPLAEQTS